MKKLITIILIIMLISIVVYGVYSSFFKRTPERLLRITFNISLTDFDYTVETFEERWCPNGDGHVLIVYKFNKLTKENIDYLKSFLPESLPVSETDNRKMVCNQMPKQYLNADVGYYIYKPVSTTDPGDFKIFIVDMERKIAVLYYQYM